jgi:CrcB protein
VDAELPGPQSVDPDLDPADERATPPRRRTLAILVTAGGGLGGLARLGLNTLLPHRGSGFPWSTFTANVAGCLLIGILMVAVLEAWPAWSSVHHLRAFAGTGVLGGFTTFSAYTSDTRALLAGGHAVLGLAYLFGSLAAGLAAVLVGHQVARAAFGRVPP